MGASNSALRRVYTVGMLIILLLIVSGWFFRFVQERIKAVDLRYHVFCEQIKPGMGQLEMRDSLSRFGDYIETNSGFKGGLEVVYITYKDPAVFHKFGGSSVVLRFVSGKYVDAFVPVPFSDANKSVCR
jgi:hypothetical protein